MSSPFVDNYEILIKMIDKVIEDNKDINEDNDFQDNLKKFVPKG
jgi:hypothetical protein